MSEENFVGGTNWVIVYPDGGWGHKHLGDGEDPKVALAGLDYRAVKRPPRDYETWNGKDGWQPDLAALQATRLGQAKAVRDAAIACEPELPDSDDPEEIGRCVMRHIGACYAGYLTVAKSIKAAKSATALAAVNIEAGYPRDDR